MLVKRERKGEKNQSSVLRINSHVMMVISTCLPYRLDDASYYVMI